MTLLKLITKEARFSDITENIVGKGENAGSPAFSPFPSMFSKSIFPTFVETRGLKDSREKRERGPTIPKNGLCLDLHIFYI